MEENVINLEQEKAKRVFKLNVSERFGVLNVLPEKGNLATFRVLSELKKKLALNAVEVEEYEVKEAGEGRIKWNAQKGSVAKDFNFAQAELKMIRSGFEKLDKEENITEANFEIAEKFLN